ncbi:hypothetical protein D9M69_351860 [compost metagenome]
MIHIDAHQVQHDENPHVQVQVGQHPVHLRRSRPLQHQPMGLTGIRLEHAGADESGAGAGDHRQLADAPGDVERGCQDVRRCGLSSHHFQQAHDVGRTEEVQPHYVVGTGHRRRDGIHIQRRRIGRQDRVRPADLVQGTEHLLLDLRCLEHRVDHQVSIGEVGIVERAEDHVHARLHLFGLQASSPDAGLVVAANLRQASVQGLAIALQQGDRNTGIGEAHGNAAAQGAGTYDRNPGDPAQGQIGAYAWNPGRLAFGEEHVTERPRLARRLRLLEQRQLPQKSLIERQQTGRLQGGQHQARRKTALPTGLVLGAIAGEEVIRQAVRRFRPGLRRPRRSAAGDQLVGVLAGLIQQPLGAGGDAVEQAQQAGVLGIDLLARENQVQRRLDADQTRQTLGTAGPWQQPQVDLRQTDTQVRFADAVAAGQGQLQSAAQRNLSEGGDQRLVDAGQTYQGAGQVRLGEGRVGAELFDIGPSAEQTAFAMENDGLHPGVGRGTLTGIGQGRAEGLVKRVDRRAVKADQGQTVFKAVMDQVAHWKFLGLPGSHGARREVPPLAAQKCLNRSPILAIGNAMRGPARVTSIGALIE